MWDSGKSFGHGPRAVGLHPDRVKDPAAHTRELEEELERLQGQLQMLLVRIGNLQSTNLDLAGKLGALEQANAEQQEIQKRRDEVMAMLIHDIKNPAGAVQLLAEILQAGDLSNLEQRKIIGDLVQISGRILQISRELSNAMVMEVRSLPLELKPAKLDPLIERVVRTNRVKAAAKQITIEVDVEMDLPMVDMDEGRIEEALDNLVNNAIKFSPPGSPVRIVVRSAEQGVQIDVVDHGPGLSEADIQKAFQFGQTLSPRPQGADKGTGLGLWIVRKIVDGHHGHIRVSSSPGRGSAFSVQLPLRCMEEEPAKVASAR